MKMVCNSNLKNY